MRISVALCTFNGARFLRQQLQSIAAQSRLPDELIVSDDGSSDETLEIVERFHAPFPVGIHRNAQRLGVVGNFERAIGLCSGEAIVLADQDDVWRPNKLARQATALENADLVFSDARRMDEDGTLLPGTLWTRIAFRPSRRRLFDVLVERNVVTGATMAFRARWRELILPIPRTPKMLHDQWIALLLSAAGRAVAIDEPLLDYREHSSQQRGAGQTKSWMQWARETGPAQYAEKSVELRLAAERLRSPDLDGRIAHLQRRSTLPRSRMARLPAVLADVGGYLRYSNHIWSIAKDLWW